MPKEPDSLALKRFTRKKVEEARLKIEMLHFDSGITMPHFFQAEQQTNAWFARQS
jgi:hypothetical protein